MGPATSVRILDVLRAMMLGGWHSRHTVAAQMDVTLATADRWLKALEQRVPGVVRVRKGAGRIVWLQWQTPGMKEKTTT